MDDTPPPAGFTALGEALWLFAQAPLYTGYRAAGGDGDAAAAAAARARAVAAVAAGARPVGFGSWARLSAEAEARLLGGTGRDVLIGDPVVATALLDRLLHHAVVVQIEGVGYRLRAHADLIPEHTRSHATITPPPAPKRRGRPPKNGAAHH